MRAHTHIYAQIYTQTHTCKRKHTFTRAYINARATACPHHTHIYNQTYMYAHKPHTYMNTHTRRYEHTNTHADMNRHTHRYAYINTHAQGLNTHVYINTHTQRLH